MPKHVDYFVPKDKFESYRPLFRRKNLKAYCSGACFSRRPDCDYKGGAIRKLNARIGDVFCSDCGAALKWVLE